MNNFQLIFQGLRLGSQEDLLGPQEDPTQRPESRGQQEAKHRRGLLEELRPRPGLLSIPQQGARPRFMGTQSLLAGFNRPGGIFSNYYARLNQVRNQEILNQFRNRRQPYRPNFRNPHSNQFGNNPEKTQNRNHFNGVNTDG